MSTHNDELIEGLDEANEQPKQMPLMGALNEELPEAGIDDIDGADSGRSLTRLFSQGTLLLMLAVLAAAGALYAMRVTGKDVSAPDTATELIEAQIEQALAKLTNPHAMARNDALAPGNLRGLVQDTDTIVGMLSADLTGRQVPVDFLKKDPFDLAMFEKQEEPKDQAKDQARQRAERLRELKREMDLLDLQTIMHGRRPVAVINGELYTAGQRLGSFTVKAIDQTTVTLISEGGISFRLQMDEG